MKSSSVGPDGVSRRGVPVHGSRPINGRNIRCSSTLLKIS